MRIAATSAGSGGRFILAIAVGLFALPATAYAQFFDPSPVLRPPADVPGATPGPAQSLVAPGGGGIPAPAPKGPMLQSLPPPASAAPAAPHTPAIPSGQVPLAVSARFGRDMPAINGGLHWRIYPTKPDQGALRPVKEDKAAAPTFALAPGAYVIHVGFGLASATKTVQLRAGESVREVFEIAAGGLRIEGKVGDVRIPQGQISFDLYKGSQFEPGDKRPIVQTVQTGDVILVAEGTYHIVSNYGDANSVVRSDIRVQTGKLTDAAVTHRAAVITLKLVSDWGGEARANTQWSVLTPGGDVIKESTGAFPRMILAEGDYRAIARNDGKSYERAFKVITGVDGEVEVLAR
ncbi:MAG: hypothetical protein QOG83_433 [Alphaproteobacteria bacterium]|nr:hypothetical protein [Alphaproteobacteria bacterium]